MTVNKQATRAAQPLERLEHMWQLPVYQGQGFRRCCYREGRLGMPYTVPAVKEVPNEGHLEQQCRCQVVQGHC